MRSILPKIAALLFTAMPAGAWQNGQVIFGEAIAPLAAEAARLTRYPVPDKLPDILIVDDETMGALGCPSRCLGLVHMQEPEVIYLNVSTPQELRSAIVVHELVHIMQSYAGRNLDGTCLAFQSNELEAHATSARFLWERGYRGELPLPSFSCPAAT